MSEEEEIKKREYSDSTMDMTNKELLAYILGLIENNEPLPEKRIRSLIIRHFMRSNFPKRSRSSF